MLDVLRVFDPDLDEDARPQRPTPLDRLMAEVIEGARYTFASVSLETLRGQA